MGEEEAPPLIVALSRNVRRLRLAKRPKMTQTDLAERAGVSRSTIALIEGAERDRKIEDVKLETAQAIARALRCTVDELIGGMGSEDPRPIVEAFRSSPWASVAKLTDEDHEFLNNLPAVAWVSGPPTPEMIYHLVLMNRAKQGDVANDDGDDDDAPAGDRPGPRAGA